MSKPRFRWWGFARSMIRDYPVLALQLKELHEQSITAGASGTGGGSSINRKTEQVAMRTLPPDDQKVYDAVRQAIEVTQVMPDGKRHLDLIAKMYWNRTTMPMSNAAYVLNISDITARRWHGAFVRLVGKCYGFEVDTTEPK